MVKRSIFCDIVGQVENQLNNKLQEIQHFKILFTWLGKYLLQYFHHMRGGQMIIINNLPPETNNKLNSIRIFYWVVNILWNCIPYTRLNFIFTIVKKNNCHTVI